MMEHSNLILALTKTDQEKQMDMELLKNIVDRCQFKNRRKRQWNVWVPHSWILSGKKQSQQTEMMKWSNGCITPTDESRVNSGNSNDPLNLSNNSFYKTNLPSNSKKCTGWSAQVGIILLFLEIPCNSEFLDLF